MKFIVYGLIDPRDLMIHYIGKSQSGIKRPRQHRTTAKKHAHLRSANWILALQRSGLDYEIAVLEICLVTDLSDRERRWVSYGRLSEWPLTNNTEGGDGAGHPHTPESKAKIGAAQRGRKHTPEVRERLRQAALADGRGHYKRSEITRAKISASNRRRKITRQTRKKMSESAKRRIRWCWVKD